MAFRSGFVCILGRPNAGKSTLLNALVGERLAIISPKPQTTRNRIQGILHIPKAGKRPGAQVILVDTPGVHKPDSSLGRKMMVEVHEALEGCDLILMLIDVMRKMSQEDDFALKLAQRSGTPVFLLLNKIDLLRDKKKMLPIIEEYRRLHDFGEVIPLSGLKKEGLDMLLDAIVNALPAGPAYFPEDQTTDQPARFMAAEIIREQVLLATKEEVPHATTVIVEQFEEGERLVRIAAAIYCERDGQKAILLGKGGQMLKKIGTAARLNMERMLGRKVFLELFVKVQPGWRDSRAFVDELDWRRQLEGLVSPSGRSRARALRWVCPSPASAYKIVQSRCISPWGQKESMAGESFSGCSFRSGKVDTEVEGDACGGPGRDRSGGAGHYGSRAGDQLRLGKEDAIELALSEALANAVVHGAKADPKKIIECDVACDETRGMLIVVRDPGPGFDPNSIPSPVIGAEHLLQPRPRHFPD